MMVVLDNDQEGNEPGKGRPSVLARLTEGQSIRASRLIRPPPDFTAVLGGSNGTRRKESPGAT